MMYFKPECHNQPQWFIPNSREQDSDPNPSLRNLQLQWLTFLRHRRLKFIWFYSICNSSFASETLKKEHLSSWSFQPALCRLLESGSRCCYEKHNKRVSLRTPFVLRVLCVVCILTAHVWMCVLKEGSGTCLKGRIVCICWKQRLELRFICSSVHISATEVVNVSVKLCFRLLKRPRKAVCLYLTLVIHSSISQYKGRSRLQVFYRTPWCPLRNAICVPSRDPAAHPRLQRSEWLSTGRNTEEQTITPQPLLSHLRFTCLLAVKLYLITLKRNTKVRFTK